MLPALAGATAAKVLVCFLYYAKFPPWGARKKLHVQSQTGFWQVLLKPDGTNVLFRSFENKTSVSSAN
jgi:hypothetical protein